MDWSTVVPLITAGVGAAGQIAAQRQAGRVTQAAQQQGVDQLNQRGAESTLGVKQRALDAQDAARLARALGILQEEAAARQAPGQRASNAVRGDILANAHDVTFNGGSSRIPKFSFSGGLHPDMFSGNTRQLGSAMSREALVDQLNGPKKPFSSLPDADYSAILNAPNIPGGTALPQGSRLDTILQAIGQYGGLGATLANAYTQPQAQTGAPSVGGVQSGLPVGGVGTRMNNPAPPPVDQPMLAGRYIPGRNVGLAPNVSGGY